MQQQLQNNTNYSNFTKQKINKTNSLFSYFFTHSLSSFISNNFPFFFFVFVIVFLIFFSLLPMFFADGEERLFFIVLFSFKGVGGVSDDGQDSWSKHKKKPNYYFY